MAEKGRASEVLPEGEGLRRAVRWIADRRREEPELPFFRLIDEAGRRFDLSPADAEFLSRNLKGEPVG